MNQNDIILIALIVVCVLVIGDSVSRGTEALSVESEITVEKNLLAQQTPGADCAKEAGCESANWKLTVAIKGAELEGRLVAAQQNKRNAVIEGGIGLILLAVIIFIVERGVWKWPMGGATGGELPRPDRGGAGA